MKKITLLFLVVFTYSTNLFAQFPETFDTQLPATWATFIGTNGEGIVENWEHSTNGFMILTWEDVPNLAEDWLVTPQVAITSTNSLLAFDQTDLNAGDFGSVLTVRISVGSSQTTHGDFVIVDTQNEIDVTNGTAAVFSKHTVDLSAYEGQSIYIAFVWAQDDGDAVVIDNVDLENQNAAAPDPVTTPTPIDGASNVFVDPTDGSDIDTDPDNFVMFDWEPASTGDPATSYDIYLGSSPTNLNLLGNTTNDAVNITGIDYSTLYYWQIVAKNSGGDAVGSSVWSFTTEANPSLSTDEFDKQLVSIYPNPTSSVINIKSNLVLSSVDIFNQLGQRVINLNSNELIGNSIDVKDLAEGMYLMTVKADNKKQTIKFIKQ